MTRMLIAVDVDGTLYDEGSVAREAVEALRSAEAAGHAVMVVTGRRWEDLPNVLPASVIDLCVALVCEEGGVLVDPRQGALTLLAERYHPEMIAALAAGGVPELDVGHVVLAGPVTYIKVFEDVHRQFASRHHIIVNKGSVALAPPNCDKGTGLRTAVAALHLEGCPIIAIGDATNDLPMFEVADHPCVVANADPRVVDAGYPVLRNRGGLGVAEALQLHLP
jgi:hydroxymethylpyrimidine pyrophosphatase-like HAD family hydrolase